jgi:hypothetical protein
MNKLLSKLPLLAFVLAATFAFGAQVPSLLVSEPPAKAWTPDDQEPSGYREITGEVLGTHYRCEDVDEECRVEFSNDDPMTGIKNVLDEGVYTPL